MVGLFIVMAASTSLGVGESLTAEAELNRYTPIDGGFQIRISEGGAPATSANPRIGDVQDNPRLHRRPLYPPADKAMIWNEAQLEKLKRCGFRPLVLAYNEPRFLFDFHSAGGLLGHLYIGLTQGAASRWFHQWSQIDVRYVDGRMEYVLHDREFPGVTIRIAASPLAESAGVIIKLAAEGTDPKNSCSLPLSGRPSRCHRS